MNKTLKSMTLPIKGGKLYPKFLLNFIPVLLFSLKQLISNILKWGQVQTVFRETLTSPCCKCLKCLKLRYIFYYLL